MNDQGLETASDLFEALDSATWFTRRASSLMLQPQIKDELLADDTQNKRLYSVIKCILALVEDQKMIHEEMTC